MIDNLWHYTSIKTLDAIFSNIKTYNNREYIVLRAGYFMNMNDPFDSRYVLNEIAKIQDVKVCDSEIPEELSAVGIPYIISFSTESDKLPMWNMYGDNGNGCALVFSKNEVEESLKKYQSIGDDKQKCEMKKCFMRYAPCEYMESEAVEVWYDNFTKENKNHDVCCVAYIIKNPDYKYEKEYRVVFLREQSELIGPTFLEAWIPVSALKCVVAGPCVSKEMIKKVIGNKDIKVCSSRVSYTNTPQRVPPILLGKKSQ